MTFNHLYNEIKQHARDEYPRECCGVVVRDKYKPLTNIAKDPTTMFRISAPDMLAARKRGLKAIVHSHPDGVAAPTSTDMEFQIETGVPWINLATDGEWASDPYVFGDQVPVPDLLDRTFRHGVTDCYSEIRDFYRSDKKFAELYGLGDEGFVLGQYPRDWEWWHNGQKLYEDYFPSEGFVKIKVEDVRYGDMFLANIRSKSPNHGGIYIGEGLILHHLSGAKPVENRKPRRDLAGRYQNMISYWCRHEGVM
jgi:proteasome lid subunit RPN8/RPN11